MNNRLIITFFITSIFFCIIGCAKSQDLPTNTPAEQTDPEIKVPFPNENIPETSSEEKTPTSNDIIQKDIIKPVEDDSLTSLQELPLESDSQIDQAIDNEENVKQESQKNIEQEINHKDEDKQYQQAPVEDDKQNKPLSDKSNTPVKEENKDTKDELFEPDTEVKKPTYYEKCDYIFKTYVDKNGLVDYDTLRRKRVDLITAAKEFDSISPADMIFWSKEEKIALWINGYNIFTLKLIVDNYPIQPHWIFRLRYPENSIMQIPGAWTKNYFKVMGMEYTLREIEREMLLTRFKDPRICFALSNSTKGGAFLRNECYRAETLDQQLEEQVLRYLSTLKGFNVDTGKKLINISNIFNTQKDSFVEKYKAVKRFRTRREDIRSYLNFITGYVPEDNIRYFESEDYSVKFIEFDWHLNEQPRK